MELSAKIGAMSDPARRLSAALAALLATASATSQGALQNAPETPDPLRVTTFNIRYGKADDGEDSWTHRKDHVVTTIRDRAPHVLGLQEALRFQIDYLEEHLPGYGVVGQGRDGGSKGEWAAILYDRERLELIRHGDFWLSPTPDAVASVGWDAALTRMCTWAVFHDGESDTWFRVWNTHFDHRGAEARAESGKLIAARVADSPLPDLVLGDLNCGEDSAALEALRGAGLRDTFRLAHPDAEEVGTFGGFRGRTGGAKIDYVLADGGFEIVSAAIDHRSFDGHDPSDHFPVHADVRFVTTGPRPSTPRLGPPVAGLEEAADELLPQRLAAQPTQQGELLLARELERDGYLYRLVPVRNELVEVLRSPIQDEPQWQQVAALPARGDGRPSLVRVQPCDELFVVVQRDGKTTAFPVLWE